jgi:hypothetical protein
MKEIEQFRLALLDKIVKASNTGNKNNELIDFNSFGAL